MLVLIDYNIWLEYIYAGVDARDVFVCVCDRCGDIYIVFRVRGFYIRLSY